MCVQLSIWFLKVTGWDLAFLRKKKEVEFSGFFLPGAVALGTMVMVVKWQRSCGPVIKF